MPRLETVICEVENNVAIVTLNRPERMNAFNLQMMKDLLTVFDLTDGDDDVKAVIVTGSGDRAFCAGADLGQSDDNTFDYAQRRDAAQRPMANGIYRDTGGMVALRIFESTKPVIGAINGAAVGFGCTVLLPMDIRLAATTARFSLPFARRGLVPESCSSWFLPRLVGIPTALEWCLSGRLFGSEEAVAKGLVSSLHEPANLLPAAKAIAQDFATNAAPVSACLTRHMLWRLSAADHPMEAHKIESRAIHERGQSADVAEGIKAFKEKRPPSFRTRVTNGLPKLFPWWKARDFE
jgi:enoyl-CoA hydratase/carnithine racemase